MSERKYESSIKFNDGRLQVTVTFECLATREEEEALREFYQQRHPNERVEIHPTEGELAKKTAFFHVSLNENLNHPSKSWVLTKIHQQAPYVLPRLIDDLKRYGKNNLREPEIQLTHSLIKGLRKIVGTDGNPTHSYN